MPESAIIDSNNEHLLIDASYDPEFQQFLLRSFYDQTVIEGNGCELWFQAGRGLVPARSSMPMQSTLLSADQSNTAVLFTPQETACGHSGYFLKLYRKLYPQLNPDVELTRYLTETIGFPHVPAYAGAVFLKQTGGSALTIGMLQQRLANVTDYWTLFADRLDELLKLRSESIESHLRSWQSQAQSLALHTADLHQALSQSVDQPLFSPEPIHQSYVGQQVRNARRMFQHCLWMLRAVRDKLDERSKILAAKLRKEQNLIFDIFQSFRQHTFRTKRIRIHGDFHLGQTLFDGAGFYVLDFEGEPEVPIYLRRIKHSPLKDVAGMIRSFHYAACAAVDRITDKVAAEQAQQLMNRWNELMFQEYWASYLRAMDDRLNFRGNEKECSLLLCFHLLEKAIYELGYELNSRPAWAHIPLQGIEQVLRLSKNLGIS